MLHLSTTLSYYKRVEIQQRIAENSQNREIAARYNDKFGKRPDSIQHPLDVMDIAKKGATSFHVSEERWINPLAIGTDMKRQELDDLRIGWDLILDIDCPNFNISKLITHLLIVALQEHGVKTISVKYSGNKGFHIGVPFEAMPSTISGKETKNLFPEGPKKIAEYLIEVLRHKIKLEGDTVLFGNTKQIKISTLTQLLNTDKNQIFVKDGEDNVFNPEAIMELDTILISSRHLYRMAYSLHEKSGLVSLPIDVEEVLEFDKERAKPENVKGDKKFLETENADENELRKLFIQAYDFAPKKPIIEVKEEKNYEVPQEAIAEEFFPPCIKKLMQGVDDGKKRALFVLINFLTSAGWDYDNIEKKIEEWNTRNKEPLHETYWRGQVRYARQTKKKIPPPNCNNTAYYRDLQVKCDESICSKCKNPLIYAKRTSANAPKEKPKKKEEKNKKKDTNPKTEEKPAE